MEGSFPSKANASILGIARRLGMWSRRSGRHAAPCSP